MRLLKITRDPKIDNLNPESIFQRLATRAIVLKGDNILLLFTERYNDYSLPGGGIDEGEDIIEGVKRELNEETGAQNIEVLKEFGRFEEYRAWHKDDYDIQHMISYCYVCNTDIELKETNLESYELNNGMKARWMNIHKALAHNKEVIASSEKKGLSIERETFLLELIVKELLS